MGAIVKRGTGIGQLGVGTFVPKGDVVLEKGSEMLRRGGFGYRFLNYYGPPAALLPLSHRPSDGEPAPRAAIKNLAPAPPNPGIYTVSRACECCKGTGNYRKMECAP